MDCCFVTDGCEEYAVTPCLVTPCYPQKCAEEPPMCYPCLPACAKGKVMYCCEKRTPKPPPRASMDRDGYSEPNIDRQPGPRQNYSRNMPPREQIPPPRDSTCCHGCCKPIRTKYVIPCYRYEDGRIRNQPTVLMRRACEVAVGSRPRRKPFVESCYTATDDKQIHRYHSEDERGNCCFHYEMKDMKDCSKGIEAGGTPQCVSCPECLYTDCVKAKVVRSNNNSCCYYCR